MNRITRFFTRIVITSAVVLAGHSCLRENFDRCPRASRVYFDFALEASFDDARVEDTVDRIDLYAFDKDGKVVGHWVDERVVMSKNYYMEIDSLSAGAYVAWANLGARYIANVPRPSRDEMSASLVLPADRALRDVDLPHLYFGESRAESFEGNRLVIPLEDNICRLNFKVEGLAANGDAYSFTVTDNNGAYSFANDYRETPPFRHIASARFTGNSPLTATMTVLRLDRDRTPALTFTNETTGEILFSRDNLVDLILQANANVDFRATRRFDVLLSVRADATISISVNGWRIETDEVQIL
ncbi:MAG: FimB/Mfa2 family fimbrial subunit [Odoribacteraceae bacterium]|jgi:hypothetical protein|nr:FimB/Mfa2 family fimbrial subunit [Odoribacteraceae bacterium]